MGKYENEIRIMFDKKILDEYYVEYFKRYPKRKKLELKQTGLSLNEYVGMVRMKQHQEKIKYAEFVDFVLERNEVEKLCLEDCTLEVNFKWKDKRRRDYDNYCITLKYFLDAITNYGLISDDSFLVIKDLKMSMENDKTIDANCVEFVFRY